VSLADTVSRFSTAAADGSPGGYAVRRRAVATFGSDGQVATGALSTFAIDAVVQTFNPYRSLVVLPEGVLVVDVKTIDTLVPLQAQPSDSITIAGDAYSVFAVDGPSNFGSGSPRYTAYAARQKVPG
jgi:hypothetical protein